MLRKKMTALSLPFCVVLLAVSLAACKPEVPAPQIVTNVVAAKEVPKSLRTCGSKPQKPTGDYSQRDVATYITKITAWGDHCKGNLSAVDRLLDDMSIPATKFKR